MSNIKTTGSKELSKPTKTGDISKDTAKRPERLNKNAERLIAEATANQQKLFRMLIGSVPHAMSIGENLIALTGFVPRGEYLDVVAERFCKPNGIGIRTAQRYCLLARNAHRLFEALRIGKPDLEQASIEQLLENLSINQALTLIRQLVSGQSIDPQGVIGVSLPITDENDWLTPPEILDPALGLLGVVDCDPCAVPGTNPLLALRAIQKPMDSLSEECDWTGKLFINPGLKGIPHSKFVERVLFEFASGKLQEALVLLPACTNAKYASLLRTYPRAFTNRPLIVSGPTLPKRTIRQPLMLVFVAPQDRWPEFVAAFNDPSSFDIFVPVTANP